MTFKVTSFDTCALLALCHAQFEVSVTNMDAIPPSKKHVSRFIPEEPVAMAKGGGGRGGGGGRSCNRGRVGSGGSSYSRPSAPAFKKISVPGGYF